LVIDDASCSSGHRALPLPSVEQDVVDGNRIKGGDPALFLYRKTASGVEELQSGDAVSERDLIQIKYQSGSHRYGVILSIDGRNAITIHLPEDGQSAVELERGRADTLGFAYELDDAPGGERFYFVSSDVPFKVESVRNAVKSIAFNGGNRKLELPDTYAQYVFTLAKDSNNAN
jgi:hypothetical protein